MTEYQLTTENNRQILLFNGTLRDPASWQNLKIFDSLHGISYSIESCPFVPYLKETARTDGIFQIFELTFKPSQNRLQRYFYNYDN
jgi:hypothetical protein